MQNQPESHSFSFSSTKAFLKKIDGLPTGPKFERKEILLTGDIIDESGEKSTEVLELWYRNPVECIQELLGNPLFKDYLHYAPTRIHKRSTGKRVFHEAWTAQWWWKAQVQISSLDKQD